MKIGFIGSGVMGSSMIKHLLNASKTVYVYTRSKRKAKEVLEAGAIWCDTPKDVALCSDLIISMVGYPDDVREIYFGNNGVIHGITKGKNIADMTTSTPDLAIELYNEFKKIGVGVLDAPVSGGDLGARNATLTIMCGGDEDLFKKYKPIFEILGKTIILQGAAGAGQHCKMCNQIALAGSMLGLVEYIKYARTNGLDPEKVLESIGSGSAQSAAMQVFAPRIFKGDLEPGFYIKHFVKDLKIAIQEMENKNERLPGLELAYSLYKNLQDNNMGEKGTQALIEYYKK